MHQRTIFYRTIMTKMSPLATTNLPHIIGIQRTIIFLWFRRSQKYHIHGRWVTSGHNVEGSCYLPRRRSKTYQLLYRLRRRQTGQTKTMVGQCCTLRRLENHLLLNKSIISKRDTTLCIRFISSGSLDSQWR